MTEESRKLGENIQRVRIQKKITQKELAVRLNVSPQYISKVENGKSMSLTSMVKVARVLEVSPSCLLDETAKVDFEYDAEMQDLINACRNIHEKKLVLEMVKAGVQYLLQHRM